MPFSMTSYFLGVGTVVGALALGFGGGIVLTNTAIKETPSGPSRVERAARAEVPSTPQVSEAKAVPVPRVEAAVQAAAEPKLADVQAAAQPAIVADPVRQIDRAKPAEPQPKQAEALPVAEPAVRQAEAPRQVEQPSRVIEAKQTEPKQVEQKEAEPRSADRDKRRAERRRIEREKRLAERERKSKTVIFVRRQQEEPDPRARPELAFQRDERQGGLFEGLFGRPIADRD